MAENLQYLCDLFCSALKSTKELSNLKKLGCNCSKDNFGTVIAEFSNGKSLKMDVPLMVYGAWEMFKNIHFCLKRQRNCEHPAETEKQIQEVCRRLCHALQRTDKYPNLAELEFRTNYKKRPAVVLAKFFNKCPIVQIDVTEDTSFSMIQTIISALDDANCGTWCWP